MPGVKPNSYVGVEESLVPAKCKLIMSAVCYDYGVERMHPERHYFRLGTMGDFDCGCVERPHWPRLRCGAFAFLFNQTRDLFKTVDFVLEADI